MNTTGVRTQHHYTKTDVETCAVAVKAGCNLELGSVELLKQVSELSPFCRGMLVTEYFG